MAAFLVLGFIILGFLIAISFGGVMSLLGFMPDDDQLVLNNFMSVCNSKYLVYANSGSDFDRRNYCCSREDLNLDGEYAVDEYCSHLHNSGSNICSIQPINYYINIEYCNI